MNDSKGADGSQQGLTPADGTTTSSHLSPEPQETPTSKLEAAVKKAAGDLVRSISIEYNALVVSAAPEGVIALLERSKADSDLRFEMLVDITVVDWLDEREERFELVYQLLSLSKKHRMTIRVPVSEDKPEVDSATGLWASANFMEREVWDMFGIRFRGHPDLRRILLYEEFVGYPLRKDYPVQGKQPRIPLRKPEVENTARNMRRPDLVSIRTKRNRGAEQSQ